LFDPLILTADDGPFTYTPSVLDVLKEKNVTATFFVNGANFISIYNETAQAMLRRAISEVCLQFFNERFELNPT
jgi:peptidoglycan/xylan/chitin deacetylase (PgdA/CDA1 family)